jgi:hypothetical protein
MYIKKLIQMKNEDTIDWHTLPDAKYIQKLLDAVKADPDFWDEEWNMVWDIAWDNVVESSLYADRNVPIWGDLSKAAGAEYFSRPFYAALGAIVVLISNDDCAYMLDSDPDELRLLGKLGDQRAILMLPACIRFKKIDNKQE